MLSCDCVAGTARRVVAGARNMSLAREPCYAQDVIAAWNACTAAGDCAAGGAPPAAAAAWWTQEAFAATVGALVGAALSVAVLVGAAAGRARLRRS